LGSTKVEWKEEMSNKLPEYVCLAALFTLIKSKARIKELGFKTLVVTKALVNSEGV